MNSSVRYVTPKAVFDTIIYDAQTYLWFWKLCLLPEVKRTLCAHHVGNIDIYRRHRSSSRISLIGFFLALALCVTAYFLVGIHGLAVNVLAGCSAATALGCYLKMRRFIATLAAALVEMDLSGLPEGITLYQLGEMYSRRYKLLSLVDLIWQWNTWMRNTVILVYFGTFGVLFLSFPRMLFWTGAGCLLVLGVLWAMFMMRKASQ